MKIRNGFVSNSSSSSFVILGIEVDRDAVSLKDVAKVFGKDTKRWTEYDFSDFEMDGENEDGVKLAYGSDVEKRIIGINITTFYTDSIADEEEFDIEENIKKVKKVLKKLKLDKEKIKIYVRESPC